MGAPELDASELVAWRNAVMSPWGPPEPSTRLILMTMSQQMGFELDACPSVELLAIRSGMVEKSVRIHLKKAVALGWLSSWRETRKGRDWYFTRYQGEWPEGIDPEVFLPGNCQPSKWRKLPPGSPPPRPVTVTTRQGPRPVNDSSRPVNDDSTTGNQGIDDRYQLPTKSLKNSSLIVGKEHRASRDVFTPFLENPNQERTAPAVRQSSRTVAEQLFEKVCKAAAGNQERPSLTEGCNIRQRLDALLMKHGDNRVHSVWNALQTQSIDQLEQAFEGKQ